MCTPLSRSWAAAILLVLGLSAGNSALAQDAALEAAAKKEGSLTLYHTMPSGDMEVVTKAFTKKYGIPVKAWRASSAQVLRRVVTEARAGNYAVDFIENNGPEMEALHREGLLAKVDSPTLAQVIPAALPPHGEWVGNTIDVFVQAYNTDQVKKEDLPKSYDDLLDPKWKGKLGIEATDMYWFATLGEKLGMEKTVDLFKHIVETNGISSRQGHSLLANLVASGEVPFALTVLNYMVPQLQKKGAPVDATLLSPSIAYFRGVGVTKNAQHPNAARLFYDFIEGETGQKLLVTRSKIPVLRDLDSGVLREQLVFVDPVKFLDNNIEWTRMFEDSVIRYNPAKR
ncbi:extracellular solute-binding protein [Bordetella petrii]|nr:extracellular solute-binding protein [Bordetella petrii]